MSTAPPVQQARADVDWRGLALDLEARAKTVESQTTERAMLAAAHGLRLMGSATPYPLRAGVVPDGWRPDFPAVMTEDYIAGLGDALEIVGDEQRYPNQEGAEHNNPPLHRCMARIEKVQEEARAALNAAPPAPAAENPTTSDSPEYTAGWKAGYKHGAWGGAQQPAERKPLTRQQLREAFHRHTGCTLGNDIGLAEHVCTVVERAHGIGVPPADAKEGE